MKLRHQLLMFSTAQLAVFGALFVLAYAAFSQSVLPAFRDVLHTKSEQMVTLSTRELDLALAAEDAALIGEAIERLARDRDLTYVRVRDAKDRVVYERGKSPRDDVFGGPQGRATELSAGIVTWSDVSVEGLKVGSVAVVLGTARLDRMQTWARRVSIVVALLWLAALAYAILFARSFVTPVRGMMEFSRKVAGGALSERLALPAPGELRELRDYLNEMTAELERRENERLAAARKTEAMQRELLVASRMAGMAEIATGVLHNVGNVLNSLNVSLSMINDQVAGSKISALARSVQLYESHPGGLPAFLATDKGKVLPDYLVSVSKRLVEENATLAREVGSITRNVEHIKTIVTMQQSYARPAGLVETFPVAPLIDDALRMSESSFARHGIEIVRDYAPDVTATTDRHKLLQILINLVSNARHALKDHGAPPLRITARLHASAAGLSIAIEDTGIGIPPQNLDKVFQHGFTTKKGGHGFGLHASANAARELGGSLTVRSEGTGRGATFTLELPAKAAAGEHEHN